jgi:signal recognition particle receptor subunit beta
VVYIIDSNDNDSIEFAKDEFSETIRHHDNLKSAVIIAIANKQDLPDAKSAEEVEDIINEGEERRISKC